MIAFKLTLSFHPFEEDPFSRCKVEMINIHPALSRGYVIHHRDDTFRRHLKVASNLGNLRRSDVIILYGEDIGKDDIGKGAIHNFKKEILYKFSSLSDKQIIYDYLANLKDIHEYASERGLKSIDNMKDLMSYLSINEDDIISFKRNVLKEYESISYCSKM